MLLPDFFGRPKNLIVKIWILILIPLLLFSIFLTLQIEFTMRIHPIPLVSTNKRSIAVRDGENLLFSATTQMMGNNGNPLKKLRRLPHVFSKVLELPFSSDADVSIQESPEFIRFVVNFEVGGDEVINDDVRARAVEIHPGVTKIVLRNGGGSHDDDGLALLPLDKLDVDTWRYRLPSSTRPELATAVLVDEKLIVTVPKIVSGRLVDDREVWEGGRRPVLVQ